MPMGKKIPIVSFLCGAITCHKTTPDSPCYENVKRENHNSNLSNLNDVVATSSNGDESPDDAVQPYSSTDQQQVPLPPPPGGLHMRAASCHHQQLPSSSSMSKLVSSLSMKVLGNSEYATLQENKAAKKDKKLQHEDSIWKKTIILGEKCKVPDEDEDDTILYDEKGKKISTYHPKSPSGVFSYNYSRQTSCINQE